MENNFLGYVPFKWPPKNGYLRFKIKKLDDDTFSGDYDILCFGLPTSSDPREHKMPIIRTRKSKRRIRIHTSTANTNNKGIVDLELDADTYHTIEITYKDNTDDERTKFEVFVDGQQEANTLINILQKDDVEIYASYDSNANGYHPSATNILIKDLEFGEN